MEAESTPQVASSSETTTLGGGCFWCLEAVFEQLRGVESVMPGYAGGKTPNPSYKQVCTGQTGHAEVVQVRFDTRVISYRDLLHIFFSIHDPTTRDRQGPDVGTQYRSTILYSGEQQLQTTQEVIAELSEQKLWNGAIVTELAPFETFYPAEEHHHQYFRRNPDAPYCQMVIAPKVAEFREHSFDRVKRWVS